MQRKSNTFLSFIQFVEALQNELEQEKKPHQEALRAVSKVTEVNQLQKNEFSARTTYLEAKLNESSLKKERDMQKISLQCATEIAQLNEDFASLAKSTTIGKRKPRDAAVSDRLISISKTLNDRNEIISSLEDALEHISMDKDRFRRECDFLRRKADILEAKSLPEDCHKEASTMALGPSQKTTCQLRNGNISLKDVSSWMQYFLNSAPTAASSMRASVGCTCGGCTCLRSDCFEIQVNYFGCDSVNVTPPS